MKTYSALGRLLFFCTMLAVEMQGSKPNAIQPCPRDPSAFQRLKQLAEEGRATAQASLADCYEQGRHVSPDGKKAIQWLTLSAQQGFAPAEYEVGRTYLYGRGTLTATRKR